MSDSPKIGAGHASAMIRLGLRELRNASNPSRESIADNEMGLYGTRTPGEVADIRQFGVQQYEPETTELQPNYAPVQPTEPPSRQVSGPELER